MARPGYETVLLDAPRPAIFEVPLGAVWCRIPPKAADREKLATHYEWAGDVDEDFGLPIFRRRTFQC